MTSHVLFYTSHSRLLWHCSGRKLDGRTDGRTNVISLFIPEDYFFSNLASHRLWHWNHGFRIHYGHVCLYFPVWLTCIDRSLATGRFLDQGVWNVLKVPKPEGKGNKPLGLICLSCHARQWPKFIQCIAFWLFVTHRRPIYRNSRKNASGRSQVMTLRCFHWEVVCRTRFDVFTLSTLYSMGLYSYQLMKSKLHSEL
jgi:hypothetical protein